MQRQQPIALTAITRPPFGIGRAVAAGGVSDLRLVEAALHGRRLEDKHKLLQAGQVLDQHLFGFGWDSTHVPKR